MPSGAKNLKILHEKANQIKNECDAVGVKTFKLYEKDIKRPSKSRETLPLNSTYSIYKYVALSGSGFL
jgi:hypothetical protein